MRSPLVTKGSVKQIDTIILTHCHMDHIGALSEIKSKLKVPVGIHRVDLVVPVAVGRGTRSSFHRATRQDAFQWNLDYG
jgi:glyoxylase-like metal-dependent hydrolase (beta-lactamase superfamily II)